MEWLVGLIIGGIVWGGWESLDAFSEDKLVKGVTLALITMGFICLLVFVPQLRDNL